MESTAHIGGHPIHPMLIPYPFALLTTAAAFDVAARVARRHAQARTAAHLNAVGIGCALVAAVPGIVDYFGTVLPSGRARTSATQHAICNLSAVACFALAHSRRKTDRLPGAGQLALEIIGTGLLTVGGWLGGNMVYKDGIGVAGEADHKEAGEPSLTGRAPRPLDQRREPGAQAPRVPETV